MFGLRFLQVDNHPVQVVIMPGRLLFAPAPIFFQKIVLHIFGFTFHPPASNIYN